MIHSLLIIIGSFFFNVFGNEFSEAISSPFALILLRWMQNQSKQIVWTQRGWTFFYRDRIAIPKPWGITWVLTFSLSITVFSHTSITRKEKKKKEELLRYSWKDKNNYLYLSWLMYLSHSVFLKHSMFPDLSLFSNCILCPRLPLISYKRTLYFQICIWRTYCFFFFLSLSDCAKYYIFQVLIFLQVSQCHLSQLNTIHFVCEPHFVVY